MEQKDIDIYEILKDEEYGTELYTPICGRVWHSGMANDKDSAKAIWTEDEDGREHFFDKNGKVSKEGEVLLFPSKEMRDWSKFFKKGDVLVRSGDNCKWLPALFIRDRGVGFESRHTALPIHSGEPASFAQCISYDGNEYLAFTSDPF